MKLYVLKDLVTGKFVNEEFSFDFHGGESKYSLTHNIDVVVANERAWDSEDKANRKLREALYHLPEARLAVIRIDKIVIYTFDGEVI